MKQCKSVKTFIRQLKSSTTSALVVEAKEQAASRSVSADQVKAAGGRTFRLT